MLNRVAVFVVRMDCDHFAHKIFWAQSVQRTVVNSAGGVVVNNYVVCGHACIPFVWLVTGPEGPLALVKSCLRSDYLLGQLGSRVHCLGFFSLAVKVKA